MEGRKHSGGELQQLAGRKTLYFRKVEVTRVCSTCHRVAPDKAGEIQRDFPRPCELCHLLSFSLNAQRTEEGDCVLVARACPTLCEPVDYSLPGFPVHGILQARILEWVASSFSRGSFGLRDRSLVSHIAGFTV